MRAHKSPKLTSGMLVNIFFCIATLLLPSAAQAQSFIEGKHYSIAVDNPRPGEVNETVEYFSFSCPGCFMMEPHIKALKEALPNLNLRRVHLPFGGRKAFLSQKAFVVMELLGATEHFDTVFSRIHVDKNEFDNQQELVSFFQSLGYDQGKVEETLNSFSADTWIRKMDKEAKSNRIRSVPTIIVNGKYKVNIKAISSSEQLASLVGYLDGLP